MHFLRQPGEAGTGSTEGPSPLLPQLRTRGHLRHSDQGLQVFTGVLRVLRSHPTWTGPWASRMTRLQEGQHQNQGAWGHMNSVVSQILGQTENIQPGGGQSNHST